MKVEGREELIYQNSNCLPVIGIVFSRDRAMQLDATLRSLILNCPDIDRISLKVLYKTTGKPHNHQYQQLILDYKDYSFITFINEQNFRYDLLNVLGEFLFPIAQNRKYKFLLRYSPLSAFLFCRLITLNNHKFVLFIVDDNLFVNEFFISNIVNGLNQNESALGFSLRLGKNTNYCYPVDQPQPLPIFSQMEDSVIKFNWTRAELDFSYPLEVSSSVYRLHEIFPFINGQRFRNPNTFEAAMANKSSKFSASHPFLMCFHQSVTFSNPINRIQNVARNRAGILHRYSSCKLAEKFDEGYRVDVANYREFVSNGCHQEVDITFIR